MRLAPITPINTADIAISGEGIEGRDERLARRARRQKKRARETAARARARSGKKPKRRAAPQAAPQPAPQAPMPRRGGFRPGAMRRPPEADLYDDEAEWEDDEAEWEDADEESYDDEDLEDFEGEVLAGARRVLGRSLPDRDARRVWDRLKDQVRRGREEVRSRRAQRGQRHAAVRLPAPPASPRQAATSHDNPVWGPVVKMGPNIAAQARHGRRMAILTLRPGLYIVADVPEAAITPTLEGGFGLAPVLIPAIKAAAKTALQSEGHQRRAAARREARDNGEGLLKRIFAPSTRPNPALPGPSSTDPAPLLLAGCCEWCDAEDRL